MAHLVLETTTFLIRRYIALFKHLASRTCNPSLLEKAAAVLQSVIINHPFIDGNKRTGFLPCEILLMEDNLEIASSEENTYDFLIKVSMGEFSFDDIIIRLHQHSNFYKL